jgi:hypothetical protein
MPAGPEFEKARYGIRHPFYQAQGHRTRSEYGGQEDGDERDHHLRGKIIEKTDQPENENGEWQGLAHGC